VLHRHPQSHASEGASPFPGSWVPCKWLTLWHHPVTPHHMDVARHRSQTLPRLQPTNHCHWPPLDATEWGPWQPANCTVKVISSQALAAQHTGNSCCLARLHLAGVYTTCMWHCPAWLYVQRTGKAV
jgi:hypothetical protein